MVGKWGAKTQEVSRQDLIFCFKYDIISVVGDDALYENVIKTKGDDFPRVGNFLYK